MPIFGCGEKCGEQPVYFLLEGKQDFTSVELFKLGGLKMTESVISISKGNSSWEGKVFAGHVKSNRSFHKFILLTLVFVVASLAACNIEDLAPKKKGKSMMEEALDMAREAQADAKKHNEMMRKQMEEAYGYLESVEAELTPEQKAEKAVIESFIKANAQKFAGKDFRGYFDDFTQDSPMPRDAYKLSKAMALCDIKIVIKDVRLAEINEKDAKAWVSRKDTFTVRDPSKPEKPSVNATDSVKVYVLKKANGQWKIHSMQNPQGN